MSETANRVIFFDIKNILLFFNVEKMIQQLAKYCHLEVNEIVNLLKTTGWGDAYETGEIDSWTLFHRLPPEIQGKRGFPRWAEAVSNVFEPNDEILSLVKELKQSGVHLCVFSNICEVHFGYAFPRFPIFHLFEQYLLSYELKMKKPDRFAYEYALQATKAEIHTSFFIEEKEEFATQAALLGIDATVYQGPATLQKQLKTRGFLS